VAVIAVSGGEGPDLDEQVPLAGDAGGEPPGAVPAGRSGLVSGDEGEPGSAGRVGPAGRVRFVPFGAAGGGCGPGAAVPDGVALAVGDGQAPGGAGVAGGGGGQVAGQVGVDGSEAGRLAGPVREVEQGGRGDGQADPAGEPGRDYPGPRPARGRARWRRLVRAGAIARTRVALRTAGPGVAAWTCAVCWTAGAAGVLARCRPTGRAPGLLPSGRESVPSKMSR
jgi:hypothetical protein